MTGYSLRWLCHIGWHSWGYETVLPTVPNCIPDYFRKRHLKKARILLGVVPTGRKVCVRCGKVESA
jgi:hypothetical protein